MGWTNGFFWFFLSFGFLFLMGHIPTHTEIPTLFSDRIFRLWFDGGERGVRIFIEMEHLLKQVFSEQLDCITGTNESQSSFVWSRSTSD
jgi:hypothetical protein